MKTNFLLGSLLAGCCTTLIAAPLTQGTFTEVINDVKVVAMPTRDAAPAKVDVLVKAPDLVRTGRESRAEMVAEDETLTRIGANTVFSFEGDKRNIRLEQGSILFHAPKGKGGGTIRTGGASAAILGSTMIVATTTNKGFKTIMLEGKCKVKLANGKSRTLKDGQMVVVTPDGEDFGPIVVLHLSKLIGGSLLVNGFSRSLPSMAMIQKVIEKQDKMIAGGKAKDLDGFGPGGVDKNTYGVAVPPPSPPPTRIDNDGQDFPPGQIQINSDFPPGQIPPGQVPPGPLPPSPPPNPIP